MTPFNGQLFDRVVISVCIGQLLARVANSVRVRLCVDAYTMSCIEQDRWCIAS